MMSLAVTLPPGELMRRTTARTLSSLAARSSFSVKSETGFSPGAPSRELDRALVRTPSMSSRAIFLVAQALSRMTTSSTSSGFGETGVMRYDVGAQPARMPSTTSAEARRPWR